MGGDTENLSPPHASGAASVVTTGLPDIPLLAYLWA
jgi:hypothetical protein